MVPTHLDRTLERASPKYCKDHPCLRSSFKRPMRVKAMVSYRNTARCEHTNVAARRNGAPEASRLPQNDSEDEGCFRGRDNRVVVHTDTGKDVDADKDKGVRPPDLLTSWSHW